jgi:hypothetical protein
MRATWGLRKRFWEESPVRIGFGGRFDEQRVGRLTSFMTISALLFISHAIYRGLCEEYLQIDSIDSNTVLKAAIRFFNFIKLAVRMIGRGCRAGSNPAHAAVA